VCNHGWKIYYCTNSFCFLLVIKYFVLKNIFSYFLFAAFNGVMAKLQGRGYGGFGSVAAPLRNGKTEPCHNPQIVRRYVSGNVRYF
jgi:hypothetical protein